AAPLRGASGHQQRLQGCCRVAFNSRSEPVRQMAGAFSVHGFAEQIFGVDEQILRQDQSDQRASARPWWWLARPRMLRSLLAPFLALPGCLLEGDTNEETATRQHVCDCKHPGTRSSA